MSFLAGRSAAAEGAYFLQESKQAVARILQKNTPKPTNPNNNIITNSNPPKKIGILDRNSQADVLPEVLKHSLPSKIFQSPPSDPSRFSSSKWVLNSDSGNGFSSVSPDALNPLRAYVSLPQVTFGPKRWQLSESQSSVLASTANELRRDKYTPVKPEKLKAVAVGVVQSMYGVLQIMENYGNFIPTIITTLKIMDRDQGQYSILINFHQYPSVAKAFAVATGIVFGSATLMFGAAVSKLDLHNGDDVKTKGKDLVQPKLAMFKEQIIPLKNWAEGTSKKWHLEGDENIQEKPIIKEFSKNLGARTSN